MITIVDYGIGNTGSLCNMFKRIGVKTHIVSDPEVLQSSVKLLLPGVGAFDSAMSQINERPGLREVLQYKAMVQKVPVLGVCLGMQLLTHSSEEGQLPGLSWIPGKTLRFPRIDGLKVPHMGWNRAVRHTPSLMTNHLGEDTMYYFVHSYYVKTDYPELSIMRSRYGVEFDSAIGCDNIYGVQFHPEKSHRFGMQILKNFAEL